MLHVDFFIFIFLQILFTWVEIYIYTYFVYFICLTFVCVGSIIFFVSAVVLMEFFAFSRWCLFAVGVFSSSNNGVVDVFFFA